MTKKLGEKIKRSNIEMVVFDSDGVLIPRGTKIFEGALKDKYFVNLQTYKVSDEIGQKINMLKERVPVCISSGRSLIYLQSMYDKVLGGNLILSSENGNLNLVGGQIVQLFSYDENYFQKIGRIRNEISYEENVIGFEPKQFILTVHAKEEVMSVYDIVKKHDTENNLRVMWNGEAFDIQEKDMSKGEGLKKLAKEFGVELSNVVAIGDRVNDKEMIDLAGIGVSADKKHLKADYYLDGELPGEALLDLLLE